MASRIGPFISSVIQDVRFGGRLLRQSPWFTLVAVTSLAVGLGASVGLFTFMNALLFRPLPGRGTAGVHIIYTSNHSGGRYGSTSWADFESFVSAAPELFAAGCATTNVKGNIAAGPLTEAVDGALISGGCFDLLGIRPRVGRLLNRTDDRASNPPAVVLSDALWRRKFQSDSAVVGREISVSGAPAVIAGVAEPGFVGVSLDGGADFWAPAPLAQVLLPKGTLTGRGDRRFRAYVRLNEGVTASRAAARLSLVASDLRAEYPEVWTDRTGATRTVSLLPEVDSRFASAPGAASGILTATLGAIAAIVAIACMNLATILVARGIARTRELNIRLALGASRRRLLRQLAVESLFISVLGSAAGILTVAAALKLFEVYRPAELPAFNLALDWRVLAFAVLTAIAAPVVFGLAPGTHALRLAIAEGIRGLPALWRRRFGVGPRELLLVVQVIVSFALLITTALFVRSLASAGPASGHLAAQRIAIVSINLNTSAQSPADQGALAERLLQAAGRVPGVDGVTAAALVPMTGSYLGFAGAPAERTDATPSGLDGNIVAPGYFDLTGTTLRAGRTFDVGDHERAPLVAIVSESMARRLWDSPAVVGRTIRLRDELREIVGVVADVPYRSYSDPVQPVIYVPLAQLPLQRFILHARVKNDPEIMAALDRELRTVDARILAEPAMPLRHLMDRANVDARVTQWIGGLAGVLQLGLALMAIWGLVAYAVERRSAEIAIRRALGATEVAIVRLVMRPSLWLLAVGAVLGCAAGIVAAHAIHSSFLGLAPIDLTVAGPAGAALTLVVTVAAWLPARRAAAIEPAAALKRP